MDGPRDASAYAGQLRQLLPRGAAWQVPVDGATAGLLLAFAGELARVDLRALDLLDEMDPRTALELLPDWERVAALPDTCTGEPDNVLERQVALHQKLTTIGAQNRAAFVEIARKVGYEITIEEHRPARIGMLLGGGLNAPAWTFVWTIHIRPFDGYLEESTFIAQARCGDRLGVRLRGWGVLNLECLIGRAAPAHTTVLFAYEVEPTPAFWFDFTA